MSKNKPKRTISIQIISSESNRNFNFAINMINVCLVDKENFVAGVDQYQ